MKLGQDRVSLVPFLQTIKLQSFFVSRNSRLQIRSGPPFDKQFIHRQRLELAFHPQHVELARHESVAHQLGGRLRNENS